MYDGHHMMWGMGWGWWLFSILVLVVIIFVVAQLATRSNRAAPKDSEKSPDAYEVLKRRYAAGEISTQEYNERKAALGRS